MGRGFGLVTCVIGLMVELEGVEPSSGACKATVLPLNDSPITGGEGRSEPSRSEDHFPIK